MLTGEFVRYLEGKRREVLFRPSAISIVTVWIVAIAVGRAAPQTPTAASSIASGNRMLQQRNWTVAADEFATAVKLNPTSAEAQIGLGIALYGSGRHEAALSAFQRAVTMNPAVPQAHYDVAVALRDVGELEKAIAEANRAVQLKPDYDDARLVLGLLLQQKGDTDAALAQYRAVVKRRPRNPEAHNWLGVAYMQKNQLSQAANEFREALKWKPDFPRAYNNLGSTLAQAGSLDDAIGAFESGLRFAPQDVQLQLNLGTALRTKGNSDAAVRQFELVLKTSPGDPEVHYQLGQTFRQTGNLDSAIREFETALALNPEYQDALYILGQTLRQKAAPKRVKGRTADTMGQLALPMKEGREALTRGDVTAAITAFRKCTEIDPGSAEAYNALGFALGRARDLPGALENLKRAVELDPQLAEAHFNLGAASWYAGEKANAAEHLDAAIRLNPASAEAQSLRAIAYRDAGDLESARRLLQRSVALNPSVPAGYFDLAVVFLRLQQIQNALGQFEAALNLPAPPGPPPDLDLAIQELRRATAETETAAADNILGRLLGLAGADSKDVIAAFDAAIRIRPDDVEARNNLGLVYTQTGNDEQAIAAFREAIRLKPDYAAAHANLGAVLTATDVPQSIRELEKAIALQPRLLKAQYNLAIAYGASPSHGTKKEIEQLQRLLAVDAGYPRAEFSLGKALLHQGSVGQAVEHLQRAVQAEPGFGEAHYQLGLSLSRLGRKEDAALELQRGRELIVAVQRDQALMAGVAEGKAALERGDADQAILKFKQIAKERPDLAEAQYQVGVALLQKRDFEGAAVAFRKTLELDSGHAGARQALQRTPARSTSQDDPAIVASFEAHVRRGTFKELEPLVLSYVRDRPQSAWGWYTLGYTYFAERNISGAINALAKSLSLDVTNAEAHKVLGRALMLIGRFDAAQVEFEQGERYNPRSPEIAYNLGKLFSIQDQWTQARAAFERALELDADYMEAVDGLGFALEALGDDAGAVSMYQKAAELNAARKGTFASPYVSLSALNTRVGNTQSALAYARKALDVDAKSDRAWFQMAKAYEHSGEFQAAVDALNRAIAINSRASSYYYVLANSYRRLGKSTESREAMAMFSKLEKESNELDQKRHELQDEGSRRD